MSDLKQNRGRITIPTDVDVVSETMQLLERFQPSVPGQQPVSLPVLYYHKWL